MVRRYRQISAFVANIPGTLAQMLRILAKAKINIFGMMVTDSIDHAVVRMVVGDPDKAMHLLGNHGILVIESEVLGFRLEDKPGALYAAARKLAAAKVNIAYTYATDGTGGTATAFIKPANLAKAAKALKGLSRGR
ncbi:MAG: ACT domain-containing protein [Planctomycetes bacterium]|jgi:hypothetical protein|nr:ACT domain-containing protein [Planctomycetota bacterium]OQC19298.1 MAG: hypothetical protein BWX69_02868 [Planctomycetes bacterium ADurb.Bin069]HPK99661.1 ACT domain-containing protein [Verrucomicrobiota bacterium]HNS00223.1 ACT domain-containing protein [Planctomycetota bacterium]HNU27530.1 ACT domain-containing protein [Planctomycetota bacterium]